MIDDLWQQERDIWGDGDPYEDAPRRCICGRFVARDDERAMAHYRSCPSVWEEAYQEQQDIMAGWPV